MPIILVRQTIGAAMVTVAGLLDNAVQYPHKRRRPDLVVPAEPIDVVTEDETIHRAATEAAPTYLTLSHGKTARHHRCTGCAGGTRSRRSRRRSGLPGPDDPHRLTLCTGRGNDIIARLVAEALSTRLRQRVIVENRAGAGGIVGSDHVVKSPPGGYTLLRASMDTLTIVPAMKPDMPYRMPDDVT
jgi:hypothetical protein